MNANTNTESKKPETRAKHTEGPWKIHRPEDCGCGTFGIVGTSDPEMMLDFVAKIEGQPDAETAEANARLIAAAPDLLAALEKALAYLIAHPPKGNIRDRAHFSALNEHANDVVKPIHDALTKATGGA